MERTVGFEIDLLIVIWSMTGCGVQPEGVSDDPGGGRATGLSLRVRLEKETYTVGEAMPISVEIENASYDPVRLNVDLTAPSHILRFVVQTPDGGIIDVPSVESGATWVRSDFIWLAPGLYVGRRIDVTRFYPMGMRGRYIINAVYDNVAKGIEFGEEAWIGKIESKRVEVSVR